MSKLAIQQYIQKAAAHEDAAGRADEKYQQQMKAAGAELFEAFKLVMADAGKPVPTDPVAFDRFYAYARKADWDAALAARKKDREWGKRLMQWHIDPEAAQARKAAKLVIDAKARLAKARLAKTSRRTAPNQGSRTTPDSGAVDRASSRISETHVPRTTRTDERRALEAPAARTPTGGAETRAAAKGLAKNVLERLGRAPDYAVEEALGTLRAVLADLDEAIRQS